MSEGLEYCMTLENSAQKCLDNGIGRELTKEEDLAKLRENQDMGLVLQCDTTQDIDFICSCCGCCCGMLSILKSIPHPLDFWYTPFKAELNPDVCVSCGICEDKCQMEAIKVSSPAVIQESKCI